MKRFVELAHVCFVCCGLISDGYNLVRIVTLASYERGEGCGASERLRRGGGLKGEGGRFI